MQSILNLAVYLRNNAEPGSVILAVKAPLVALVTELPVVGGPYTSDQEDFIEGLKLNHVRYVIVESSFKESKKYFLPVIQDNMEKFKLVHKQKGSNNLIFEFRP